MPGSSLVSMPGCTEIETKVGSNGTKRIRFQPMKKPPKMPTQVWVKLNHLHTQRLLLDVQTIPINEEKRLTVWLHASLNFKECFDRSRCVQCLLNESLSLLPQRLSVIQTKHESRFVNDRKINIQYSMNQRLLSMMALKGACVHALCHRRGLQSKKGKSLSGEAADCMNGRSGSLAPEEKA